MTTAEKVKQLGQVLRLTDRLINSTIDEQLVETLQRIQTGSFLEAMLDRSAKAINVEQHIERDASTRSTEIATIIDTLEDTRVPMMAHRAFKYAERATHAMIAVNDAPWWKLLWLKLRRKPIVAYKLSG